MSNVNVNEINYDKLKIDKEDNLVYYSDDVHKYWTKKTKQYCISVTTLIHTLSTFDEGFWSKYKALQKLLGEDFFDGPVIGKQKVKGESKEKRGPASEIKQILLDKKSFNYDLLEQFSITKEQFDNEVDLILSDWFEKRETSCIRGTAIHKEHEMQHLAGNTEELKHLGLEKNFTTDTSNNIEIGKQRVYPELLLSRISEDGKLRIAGQADLVIIDGNDVYILDYKTGKTIDQKSYYDSKARKSQKLKYPLNNIDDCNFMHYSLQLSTYAWMIQKINPAFNIKGLILIHYDHDGGCTNYECKYLKSDVERMLAYHKKQIENDEFNNSKKKIIF